MISHHRHIILCSAVIGVLLGLAGSALAQRKNLVVRPGASFTGSGTISVQDSILNDGVGTIRLSGRLALVGTDQTIGSASTLAIAADTLIILNGAKQLRSTIEASDSLLIGTGATLIASDTLRVGGGSRFDGVLQTSANSVVEFFRSDGISQNIPGNSYRGIVRLRGSSPKAIIGNATIDTLEQTSGPLSIGAAVAIGGRGSLGTVSISPIGILSSGARELEFAGHVTNAGTVTSGNGGIRFLDSVFVVSSGILRSSANTDTLHFSSGLTFLSANSSIELAGTGIAMFSVTPTIASSANLALSPLSTCIYGGTNQVVLAGSYGTLVARNAGIKTLSPGIVGIAGAMRTESGSTIDAQTNDVTVDFNGPAAQDAAALTYRKLRFSGDRAGQEFRLPSDTIRVLESFANSLTNVSTIGVGNTFEYAGTIPQTIEPFPYHHLVLSGSGPKSLLMSQSSAGDVVLRLGSSLTVDAAANWMIGGIFQIDGALLNEGTIDIAN